MFGNPFETLRVALPADGSYAVEGGGPWRGPQYLAITNAVLATASELHAQEMGRWNPNNAAVAAQARDQNYRLSRLYPAYVDPDQAAVDAAAIIGNREVLAATLALAQRLGDQPYLRGEEIAAVLGRFDLANVPEARNAKLTGDVPAVLRYGPGVQGRARGRETCPGAALRRCGGRLRHGLAKMRSGARGSRL
jgi:hypothetical protein